MLVDRRFLHLFFQRFQPQHHGNRCIGCGVCTTKCEFDAIHLTRDVPEASRMTRTEDKMKAILPHMVKRAAKLTIKDIKGKRAK